MDGNVWVTFLALLAVLIIGYEIGKTVMAQQYRNMLKNLGNTLSAYAEQLKTKQKDGVAVEHGESSKNS